MRCLGHHLAGNSTISDDFNYTVKALWGSLWGNCSDGLRMASDKAQCRFMRTSLQPVAGFRWSRWPWQHAYAQRLDAVQRHMIGCIRPVKPARGEDMASYVKRRSVACGRLAIEWGRWSRLWAKDNVAWEAHILRAHDPKNWCLPLRQWHGEDWLQQQRFDNSFASHWGRTRTRSHPGHPATRWHEGIRSAKVSMKQ